MFYRCFSYPDYKSSGHVSIPGPTAVVDLALGSKGPALLPSSLPYISWKNPQQKFNLESKKMAANFKVKSAGMW